MRCVCWQTANFTPIKMVHASYEPRSTAINMKPILLLLLLPLISFAQGDLLADVRSNVALIFKEVAVSDRLNARFETADVSSDPLLKGYKGALIMAKGRHAANPFQKLSIFNTGKALLDEAITSDSKNLELRFLRLTIQVNVPGILNYSGNIKHDRAYLDSHLGKTNNEEFKKQVTAFIEKAEKEGKL